jgi:hypothetical protein
MADTFIWGFIIFDRALFTEAMQIPSHLLF